MAGEKYVIATSDNSVQIAVRNILNPRGYIFLGNCSDGVSLIRLVRSYSPDIVVVDLNMQLRDLRLAVETIDDEMMCTCIVLGDSKELEMSNLFEKSKSIVYCPKPLSRELLLHTVELALVNYRRISDLNKKLKEMTENLETRKLVDRAKWILMQRDGLDESEAYERMRRKSMDTRMSMKALAEAIITAYEIGRK